MKKRVFWSMMLSSILILLLTSILIITALYEDFVKERKQEIANECAYIAAALKVPGTEYLKEIGGESPDRITLIADDGAVLYDNFADAQALENHLNRPEIKQARKQGSGQSTRLSKTLGERTYYYAVKLDNGEFIRVSTTTKSLLGIVQNASLIIVMILLCAVIIAALTAKALTKKIVDPLNRLDLDDPLSNNTYDELSSLLLRMDKQNKKIADQLHQIEEKQKEFKAITDNMNEALVIFGDNRQVISANKSAGALFDHKATGNIGYLELCRDTAFIRCVEAAFSGKYASDKLTKNGRTFQLSVNPVKGENGSCAAVLLAVDVTEKEQNEQMRREFTANVSHELKTPLTSIMGYAEIMQNGIAKEEDYQNFIGKIYAESKRLLNLIEDIINLSRLDEEGMKNEFVPVDLYALSQKVAAELKAKAEKNNVSLSLKGESLFVDGVEETLHEIIYNLCDNAITYNKENGSVTISTDKKDGRAVLTVSDTGIGIAAQFRSRIFERFYRIDKSRSKETGGTGLGLSIVKHGAMLHNAEIKLESKLGEGTAISILF